MVAPSMLTKHLARFPLKTLVAITALSLVSVTYPPLSLVWEDAEFYPLSSFPMYSSFAPHTNLVFITNEKDQPLPAYPTFRVLSSALKKSYAAKLADIKADLNIPTYRMTPAQKKPAGDALLRELKESVAPAAFENNALPHLKLYEIIIKRDEAGQITHTQQFITELTIEH
ncbi:MAG: hypothetical protein AAGD22_11480 [Verrucomicrobiota bacterium]